MNAQQELKRRLDEVDRALQNPKKFYKNTLIVVSLLFLLNGVFLYFGTMLGGPESMLDVAKFYGFDNDRTLKDNFRHPHLQRTAGIFCFVISILNFLPILINSKTMLFSSMCVNVMIVLHYAAETFYFKSVRAEVMFLMLFILVINVAWAARDYYHTVRLRREKSKLEQQLKSQ